MAATLKCDTIQNASSATVNAYLDGNGNLSVGNSTSPSATSTGNINASGTVIMGSSFLRNRIINGGMVVSQRNGTSSVNVSSDSYTMDRWLNRVSGGGVITNQQTTSVVPTNFSYALALTVQTADSSIAAGDVYQIGQRIEGYNTADFGWGTASAQTVTLSFWVRSSVTGTYGVGLQSASNTRSYVTTYSIASANTWTYVTLTIPGDTSGTQNVSTGIGVDVIFDLGSGTSSNATAGSWGAGGSYWRTSSCVNWIANAGATFYITGVQLEVGSVATPFERRQYGQELALCQRYLPYWKATAGAQALASGYTYATTGGAFIFPFPVAVRTPPTGITISAASDFQIQARASTTCNSVTYSDGTLYTGSVVAGVASGTTICDGGRLSSVNGNAFIYFTGCEL